MKYSPWADLAAQPDLSLVYESRRITGHRGLYDHRTRTITLDPGLVRRQARSVLAHELRHAFHSDMGHGNPVQENRADREAARLMIDVRDLGRALQLHDEHHESVAIELNVSNYLLGVRLKALHPSEAHLIRRIVRRLGSVA